VDSQPSQTSTQAPETKTRPAQLWADIQYTPRPTPKLGNPNSGKRFKFAQMLKVVKEVNDECTPIAESILADPNIEIEEF
jgi:hypothetical protein